jgi:hypothetical protein
MTRGPSRLSAPNLELLGRWDGPADYILGTSTSAHITFLELSGFSRRGNQPNRIWITLHFVFSARDPRPFVAARTWDGFLMSSFVRSRPEISFLSSRRPRQTQNGKNTQKPGKEKEKNNLKKKGRNNFHQWNEDNRHFLWPFLNFIGTRPHAIGPPPPSHRVRKLILLLKTRL